ncbi:phosphate signaling complex protein PhoU [Bacillus sp. 03113]|uniref:phosphate signaling complex protein PhoU n=1 Tax=Bacillus sp. 03113 TaxID=2578211 RepID=UPI00114156A9|nr:phosphate signaling complex protein PhoU [Bacillus sp. 03113]
MAVREKFDYDLKELQNKLLEIGRSAEEALTKALGALETKNVELALQIMEEDSKINLMYEEINDFAILLIAKQQPVAIDLRRIIVGIKIATEIERIADFAVNIAKATIRIGNKSYTHPIFQIKKMHTLTTEMLQLSLKAYTEEDILLAKKVAGMDNEVDDIYDLTMKQLLEENQKNPDYVQQITHFTFICRFLERAADHITNIAENVYYLVKGRHYDLNK